MERKFSYKDFSILPSIISDIEHREECNPYTNNGKLPIFTAPMSTVVNEWNFNIYEINKIIPILPRNIKIHTRINYVLKGKWVAFSLKEFEENFCNKEFRYETTMRILIDVANGHMQKLYDVVKKAKAIYKENMLIMVGNIANPETYKVAYESGADYVRMSIGTGAGCITASNVGIYYPIGSLIAETVAIRKKLIEDGALENNLPKIIADGGIRNYDDAIKALALGADYVMIGSIFASALEGAGKMRGYIFDNEGNKKCFPIDKIEDVEYNKFEKKFYYNNKEVDKITKIFYGMASSEGQKDLYGKKIKTSEGIIKELEVKYDLKGWAKNFTDFLCSAMSYTNAKILKDFKENTNIILITNNASNAINH